MTSTMYTLGDTENRTRDFLILHMFTFKVECKDEKNKY